MTNLLLIASGGALGALMRFWISSAVNMMLGRSFPYGTLSVNLLGSFLIGLFSMILLERLQLSPEWRSGLIIGFLGAFTTFSTFSIETLTLLQQGDHWKALLNMFLSVVLCIAAAGLGLSLGKHL